jgi:hypothetical protein
MDSVQYTLKPEEPAKKVKKVKSFPCTPLKIELNVETDTGEGQASVLSGGGCHLGISSHPRSWNLSLVMSGSEQNNTPHNYADLRVTSVSMCYLTSIRNRPL